jgi:undecaprenyl-diphosphatase
MVERLLSLDARLSRQLSLRPGSGWWFLFRLAAHLGDGPLVFGGLALGYGLGWLWANPQLRQAVIFITLIVLVAMIVVTLIKFRVRRQRPRPPGEFVTFQYDAYSFPSGHAARLAALATTMMFFDFLPGWSFMALAASVAVARVAVGIHYLSDVIIGMGLGILVAGAGLALLLYLSPLG